ncbi:hypothetical protein V6N13_081865 [Hibiscus sabdariffa]
MFATVKANELQEFSNGKNKSALMQEVPHQAIEDEVKAKSPLKKFASLPHHSEQLTKTASVTSATMKADESKEFSNGKNNSALMQEGREANNAFELERLSPGGPDPYHHR